MAHNCPAVLTDRPTDPFLLKFWCLPDSRAAAVLRPLPQADPSPSAGCVSAPPQATRRAFGFLSPCLLTFVIQSRRVLNPYLPASLPKCWAARHITPCLALLLFVKTTLIYCYYVYRCESGGSFLTENCLAFVCVHTAVCVRRVAGRGQLCEVRPLPLEPRFWRSKSSWLTGLFCKLL